MASNIVVLRRTRWVLYDAKFKKVINIGDLTYSYNNCALVILKSLLRNILEIVWEKSLHWLMFKHNARGLWQNVFSAWLKITWHYDWIKVIISSSVWKLQCLDSRWVTLTELNRRSASDFTGLKLKMESTRNFSILFTFILIKKISLITKCFSIFQFSSLCLWENMLWSFKVYHISSPLSFR